MSFPVDSPVLSLARLPGTALAGGLALGLGLGLCACGGSAPPTATAATQASRKVNAICPGAAS